MQQKYVLRVHFHLPQNADGQLYRQLLELLETITPTVQALEPNAADCEIGGALRYFDRTPHELAQLIRLRALALHGVHTTVGGGGSRMIAAMAADATPSGSVTCIHTTAEAVATFLRPRPVPALYGIGPSTATTLSRYGLTTIGQLADAPLLTLQKILGASTGRLLHERARGIDRRPVVRAEPDKSISSDVSFARDELDPDHHHQALLAITERLGYRMRTTRQVCRRLTLTVRYADRSTSQRTRTLAEATNHGTALAHTTGDLYDALGLQRARVVGIAIRAEALAPAQGAHHQLTFDADDDKARRIEAAADRARARFGHSAVKPAALARGPLPVTPNT